MRIDKFFSTGGLRTRSEIKSDIKKGFVSVNGEVVTKPDFFVDENKDQVTYKGQPVIYEKYVYYILNKPAGYVTARTDDLSKTVMELIPDNRKGLSPVGRLDKDTEGLLIITDDGELNHYLMSPKHHVPKTYFAKVSGIMDENDVELFEKGIDIGDDKPCLPAKLEIVKNYIENDTDYTDIMLTIEEGRYHQVKRMVEAASSAENKKKVEYLRRDGIGNYLVGESIELGKCKKVSKNELLELLKG